jgi:TonB-dependent receptor
MTNKLRGYLLAATSLAAGFSGAWAQDNQNGLETVTVTGYRESMRQAIDIKRTSVNAVDAIASEDIGKMPDQNVAESLQRLPGITIDRNRGVGGGVTVRGLGPQFNTVTVNGRVVATTNAGREFDWDLLPSELITGANVFKSPQANINGASIGATIDIRTLRPLDQKEGFQLGGSAHANYDEMSGMTTPSAAAYVTWKSDDSRLGVALVVAYDAKSERTDNFFVGASSYPRSYDDGYYGTATKNGGTLCVGSVSGGVCTPRVNLGTVKLFRNVDMYHNMVPQTEMDKRKRTGANLTVQYAATPDLLLTFDGFLSREQNHFHSSGLAPDFSGGTLVNQVVVGGTDTTETVAGIANVPVHVGGTAVSETFSNGTVDEIMEDRPQNFITALVGANATWTHGAFTVALDADVSSAGNHDFHGSFQTVREKGVNFTYDRRTGSPVPSLLMTNSYPNAAADTTHRDAHYVGPESALYNDLLYETKVDSSWKSESVTLSAGIGWSHRKKGTDGFAQDNQCAYCGSDVILPSSLFTVTKTDWMSGVDVNTERHWLDWDANAMINALKYANTHADPALHSGDYNDQRPDPAASSNVQEEVWTGYLMSEFKGELASMPVAVNAGVRIEDTSFTSTGFGQAILSAVVNGTGQELITLSGTVPVGFAGHYTDILPSLNVRLNILDDLILRGAASRVISRPTLTDLSPAQSITSNPGNERISRGNPNLLPFRASQAEAGLEWYYDADSVLSGTFFYKSIDSFITRGTDKQKVGDVTFIVDTPMNGQGASVKGIELSYRTTFTQLPHPFDGLGAEVSYTYTDSDADYTNTAKVTSHYSLQGLSKNSYTFVAFYEMDPIQVRVSFTRRDKYLVTAQTQTGVPQFNHGYGQLDAGLQYNVTDNIMFTLDGSNLTDQAEWTYDNVQQNTGEYRITGRRLTGGIRVKF